MAKSGVFRVHLKSMMWGSDAKGAHSGWGEGMMYAIGMELKGLLQAVCDQKASGFMTADYSWDPGSALIAQHEPIIYFLNSNKSLIAKESGTNPSGAGIGGATWMSGVKGMISEVYLDNISGDSRFCEKVARVAFHELMHNKLDAEEAGRRAMSDIHKSGGGGLALHHVEAYTPLTNVNKQTLAPHLDRKVNQYTAALSKKFYLDV